jgi:hypothetical protein
MSHRRGLSRPKAACVLVLGLAVLALFSVGCGKKKTDEEPQNVVGSAMDAGDVSLRDLAELRKDAEDHLAVASLLATEAERTALQEAQAEKTRADAFFDQKAYKEAQQAYQNVVDKCKPLVEGRVP